MHICTARSPGEARIPTGNKGGLQTNERGSRLVLSLWVRTLTKCWDSEGKRRELFGLTGNFVRPVKPLYAKALCVERNTACKESMRKYGRPHGTYASNPSSGPWGAP